jgi:hypothetical protein
MRSFTRWLLVLLLVATSMMVATDFASANTELVPASRLVAPFVTIETGRSTFLFITNVSALQFRNVSGATGGVHLEFYDKTCVRSSTTIELSPKDIDQVNVTDIIAGALSTSKIGFVDIDVRTTAVFTDPLLASGIRANVIMGEVVIADNVSDFALAYPMAASLGSSISTSTTIADRVIVTRNASGAATNWTGRYEAYPSRLFVPGFFAEGSPVTSTFLAVVSPADGNWHGNGLVTGANSEAPGENLVAGSGSTLLTVGTVIWDGCEKNADKPVTGHTLMDTLGNLFGTSAVNRANWTAANCTAGSFPGLDELSGQPTGWIDLPNTSTTVKGGAGTGTARNRGMVGIMFEVQAGKGDVERLWGDPTSVTGQSGCTFSNPSSGVGGGGTACPYNLTPLSLP